MSNAPCKPGVAQDRDLFGDLTRAGICPPCRWRGEQRNTFYAADSDARAHRAECEDKLELSERLSRRI